MDNYSFYLNLYNIAACQKLSWVRCVSLSVGHPWRLSSKELAPAGEGELSSIRGLQRSLEKKMATRSSILAWKSQWQRTLVVYSPWRLKKVTQTYRLNNSNKTINFKYVYIFYRFCKVLESYYCIAYHPNFHSIMQ